jgi:hypothetical protein
MLSAYQMALQAAATLAVAHPKASVRERAERVMLGVLGSGEAPPPQVISALCVWYPDARAEAIRREAQWRHEKSGEGGALTCP